MYQWNVWGTDNVGKITANGDKFFYLKDHLGTIRVVLDESNQIVSATDYDPWGYPIDGRTYQSDPPWRADYKFTGKQRDTETGLDYFGARYYDARIGNWTTTDPLFEKRIGYSPYNYVTRNPITLIDFKGLFDDYYVFDENGKHYKDETIKSKETGIAIKNSKTNKIERYCKFNDPKKDEKWLKSMIKKYGNDKRYVYVKSEGEVKEYMEKSGVANLLNQLGKFFYAATESPRGGKMDYVQYLSGEMKNEYNIDGIDVDNDRGGFYIFPSEEIAYNSMDAGNYLWGRGMHELGFMYSGAYIAEQAYSWLVDNQPDSPFDKEAIEAGYNSIK